MARLLFWDVDTQYDFMHADGKLYVPGAEEVIANLRLLRDYARDCGIRTVASADDHLPGHAELSEQPDFEKTFPPHCLHGTPGQEKIPETRLDHPLVITPVRRKDEKVRRAVREHGGDILVLKHEVDVFSNPNVDVVLDEIDPDVIVLFRVALDVCDRYAVEGLLERRPQTRIRLVTDAVKAIDPAAGERLLAEWRGRGVELVTTAQILAERTAHRLAGTEST